MADQAEEAATPRSNRSLETVGLLSVLPADLLRSFDDQCSWSEFAAGDVILEQGEGTSDVHFVLSGAVRVVSDLDGGREVAFADVPAGGFFGEFAAIDGSPRSARAICSERAVIAVLPREAFLGALRDHPEFALRLIQYLVQVIRKMTGRVGELSGAPPQQRIYAELLRRARPSPAADGTWLIEHVPPHHEIATASGTDRENVSAAIGGLIRDGIVRRRHMDMVVSDYHRLRKLAEP